MTEHKRGSVNGMMAKKLATLADKLAALDKASDAKITALHNREAERRAALEKEIDRIQSFLGE